MDTNDPFADTDSNNYLDYPETGESLFQSKRRGEA